MFAAFHAGATWQLLRARQIGACSDVSPELLQDFRRLRAEMQAAHMFQSSKLYYAWKCTSNLAICAASLSILRHSSSFTAVFAAAFLMVRHQPITLTCALPLLTGCVRRRCSGSSVGGWHTTSCTTRCGRLRPTCVPCANKVMVCVATGLYQPFHEQRRRALLWQLVPGGKCSCVPRPQKRVV